MGEKQYSLRYIIRYIIVVCFTNCMYYSVRIINICQYPIIQEHAISYSYKTTINNQWIYIYMYEYYWIYIYMYIWYTHLSIYLSIYLSIDPSIHPSIHPSIYLSIYFDHSPHLCTLPCQLVALNSTRSMNSQPFRLMVWWEPDKFAFRFHVGVRPGTSGCVCVCAVVGWVWLLLYRHICWVPTVA